MSGGFFDYNQFRINEIVDKLKELITEQEAPQKPLEDEYDYSYKYLPKTIEIFKEVHDNLIVLHEMVQRIDWMVECDDSEEDFYKRIPEELTERLKEFYDKKSTKLLIKKYKQIRDEEVPKLNS